MKSIIPLSILFLLIFLPKYCLASQSWCWTKPIHPDKFHLDPKLGGENWGYCQEGGQASKIPYTISIDTGTVDTEETSDSYFLQIYGEEGQTHEILLSNSGFQLGSTTIVKDKAMNVGDLTKVRLRTTGSSSYRCKQIRVDIGTRFWDFDCNNILACPKMCAEELFLAGNQHYSLSIKTSNDVFASTKAPIYIELIGVDGRSPKKLISETGFERGENRELTLETKDVGAVYGVVLSMYKSDDWTPSEIIVKRAGKEVATFESKGQSIKCPLQCSLSLMNQKPGEEDQESSTNSDETGNLSNGDESQNQDNTVDDGSRSSSGSGSGGSSGGSNGGSESEEPNDFENTYQGAGLSQKERKNIIELTCDSKVKDNDNFGPLFSTSSVNFQSFIAVCPHNCWKPGHVSAFGVGIHPEESSICRSAIIDRSMPLFGGVIGVSVTHGLSSYDKGPTYAGLEVKMHKVSKKSFHTYKIDNADMMASDMRIIDDKGSPNFVGRLEFRMNGVWGTVCAKKMTNSAAKRICQQLKFQDGTLKSLNVDFTTQKGYCKSFKGEDFCGPLPQPIHYMALNCDGIEGTDIMKCYREIADMKQCSHDDDAIIECTNVDFAYPQDPVPGMVRLVDHVGAPSVESTGRLEVFMGQWGSVCNSKFTDKAAHVACRQMGFISGKIMGTPGQTGFCSQYKGKNFCGSQQISLADVDCKGSEENIKECGGSSSVVNCNHEQDIIVSCDGTTGDTSGRSQLPKIEISSPNYGKLPLPPIITAGCDTKSTETIFRGDPGSIFLVNCPAHCDQSGGIIWGTGIYTAESSICRAAFHLGVISNSGGLVEMIKQPGLTSYAASTHRGITSTPYNGWSGSFTVTKSNLLALKMSQSIRGKEKTSSQGALGFLQVGASESLQSMGSKPLFSWFPPIPNFEFDGKTTKVKTQGINDVDKVAGLTKSFAIATRITRKSSEQRQMTILSHSSCGGFALVIKETTELGFGERCNENFFWTGYYVPIETSISIVINYDTTKVDVYVNGEEINKKKITFNFKLQQNLDIGSYSENTDETFSGQINYALFYDQPLPLSTIHKLAEKGLDPDKKGQKLKNTFTLDNRLCVSDCSTNPIPGSPGSSSAPAAAKTNQGEYPDGEVNEGMGQGEGPSADNSNSNNNNNNNNEGSSSNDAEKKAEEVTQEGTNQLKCEMAANDKKFEGATGKTFRVSCPKNCAQHPDGNIFGNLIYSDDSSICKAAIHAGFVSNAEGGEFFLEIANGLEHYESNFKNDISSASRSASTRSFILKEASALTKISCEETAASSKFIGASNTKFTVLCPPECSKITQKLYGNQPFTDDSSICQAAIFAGVLTDKGGEVSFMISEGQSTYKGGSSNGVKSLNRDTYIRSFKMLGSSRTACNFFKETYEDLNLLKNWKVINSKGLSTTKPGAWSYNANPLGFGLAFKQTNDVMGSEYNYGTSLINKAFECGEGVYSINVYTEEAKQGAVLFRFSDDNNFYAVEFNQPGENKLRLIKKSQGTGTVLKASHIDLQPKEWYRFKIAFHGDNLQVWLQKNTLRNTQLIFNVTDNDVQMGTVGFAAQGNSGIYFDGAEVKPYDPKFGIFNKMNREERVWDSCLIGSEEGRRKKFCKTLYGSYTEGKQRCEELHNFCEICCDRVIPKQENILNYACWKGCVKDAKEKTKKSKMEELVEVETIAFVPKLNDKIDYKPESLGEKGYFLTASIIACDKEPKDNKEKTQKYHLRISYILDNQSKTDELTWPSERVKKCGEALPGRTDCKK